MMYYGVGIRLITRFNSHDRRTVCMDNSLLAELSRKWDWITFQSPFQLGWLLSSMLCAPGSETALEPKTEGLRLAGTQSLSYSVIIVPRPSLRVWEQD